MDWIKFEKAKTLKQAVVRSQKNVGYAEDYSAIKLKLYDKKQTFINCLEHNINIGGDNMIRTKDWLFGEMSGNTDYTDESINFLGELCDEPYRIDIDDYLYEAYKEDERMEDLE